MVSLKPFKEEDEPIDITFVISLFFYFFSSLLIIISEKEFTLNIDKIFS